MKHQSEQKNDIQQAFESTVKNSNLHELGIDIAETTIDSIMKDGLLKDLPIVGMLASLTKLGANIKDKLFLKKILSFLSSLKDIPAEDRNRIIKEIDDSKKYRIKVGEKLLYVLDKCDDYEIAELVGVVFKNFIERKITYDDFIRVVSVLNNLTMIDFNKFINLQKSQYNFRETGELISTGLLNLSYDAISVDVSERRDPIKSVLPNSKTEYETEVDGGIYIVLSPIGKIILNIFGKKQ